MDFLSKLDRLMRERKLNKHTLSQQSGIPYTTLVGLWERGKENARLSTVNRLCEFFGVSLDYLAVDSYENPEDFVPKNPEAYIVCEDPGEIRLIAGYRSLNAAGQAAALAAVEGMTGSSDLKQKKQNTGTA